MADSNSVAGPVVGGLVAFALIGAALAWHFDWGCTESCQLARRLEAARQQHLVEALKAQLASTPRADADRQDQGRSGRRQQDVADIPREAPAPSRGKHWKNRGADTGGACSGHDPFQTFRLPNGKRAFCD